MIHTPTQNLLRHPDQPTLSHDMELFAGLIAHMGLATFDSQFLAVIEKVFAGVRCTVDEIRNNHDQVCILDSHHGERGELAAMKLQVRGAIAAHLRGGSGKAFRVHQPGYRPASVGVDAGRAVDTSNTDFLVFTCSAGKVTYAVCITRPGTDFSTRERKRFVGISDWLAASIIKDKEKRVIEFRYGDGVVNRIVGMSPRFSTLSPREKSVCVGILTGHTTEAIALHLEVSENSVLTYRRRFYQKLGINAQNELFASALVAAREMIQSSSLLTVTMPL